MKSILSQLRSSVLLGYRTAFRLSVALALLVDAPLVPHAHAQATPAFPLHVAAAADLQPVLPSLAAEYERATGTHLVSSFGSSATLAQQISNGAPVDLFLSADCDHPQQLAAAHLAAAPVSYATGVLVLWARKDSPAQPLSLASLSKSSVSHIAVANDRHAPYGQAATAELHALQLDQALAPRLVVGENIMQTAQFADTGNAQAALISLTIASSPHFRETGSFLVLPRHYPPIRQCAAVLQHAPNAAAAEAFVHWLTSHSVQSRLPSFGLDPAQP